MCEKKISIIVGTRPEIIKMSPIIKECIKNKLDYFVLHTGQHYSYNLDKIFFKELNLPTPKYNINCDSNHIGKMINNINKILLKEKPNIVLIEGDTFSVLSGATSTFKSNINIGHIEAGLRSFDISMPEEVNRIYTDHISDYLFAPTQISKNNLINEGINKNIFVVGNTIVDMIYENINSKSSIINDLGIDKNNFILLTLHRQENVDNKEILSNIFKSINIIYKKYNLSIIYPIHPRTKKMINKFNLKIPKCINLIEPISFFDFLNLEKNASIVLTDSGGVQEETCILKTPCITLRNNTERPETIKVGSNVLVGTNKNKILNNFERMINKKRNWKNPFGDGSTGKKIIKLIK